MHTMYRNCLFVTLALTGCATTATLMGGKSAPGARGEVKVTQGNNGNSKVHVEVKHLAAPGEVLDGAAAYVVWVQSVDHVSPPQNVGELRVDGDLEGSLSTVTSMPAFDLTITPETSGQVLTTVNKPVLSARVECD
jgi:hypothetical protein